MQTRRQKHNPGSLWTGNPGMSNAVYCMHVSRSRCEWQVFFIQDVTRKIRNNKDTNDGKWFIIAPRSITSITWNNFEIIGIAYSIIYPLHYPSLQWWCMPPHVQKPLKKHEHAFEMHFSPEPLCNIGKITCVSCCTSPRPVIHDASESLLEGTRSHSDPGDDSHNVEDVRANCLEGSQETKHLSETLELNIEKCQTNVSVIFI